MPSQPFALAPVNLNTLAAPETTGDGTFRFNSGPSRHHRPFFDDYNVAKAAILQQLGDISAFELFGRQVMVAVFARPKVTLGGLLLPEKEQTEDWYQHKVGMVVKLGPDAFTGDDSYIEATFGGQRPQIGDWLVSNASSGIQMSIAGEGGTRVQITGFGKTDDAFKWDGWPCRIMADENFVMRIANPHGVV